MPAERTTMHHEREVLVIVERLTSQVHLCFSSAVLLARLALPSLGEEGRDLHLHLGRTARNALEVALKAQVVFESSVGRLLD